MKTVYKDLILFRNELKNNKVPRYKMIGIVSELLLNKDIFKKNIDIVIFLKDVLGLKYKNYVIRSRTMIIAKTVRIIHNSEEKEYILYKKNLMRYIGGVIERAKEEGNMKKEKNNFNGWLNSINEE